MERQNAGRLALEIDDGTGLLIRLRMRPNAFNLHVTEDPLLKTSPAMIGSATREIVETALWGMRSQSVLELKTCAHVQQSAVTRTLRCPLKATADRQNTIEFEYHVKGLVVEQVLLCIDGATACAPSPMAGGNRWQVLAYPYRVFLSVFRVDESTQLWVVFDPRGDRAAPVYVKVSAPNEARLGISITILSVEIDLREPILQAVPVPLDLDTAAIAVTTPSSFPPPGGRPSTLSWARPQPLIVFPRDETEPDQSPLGGRSLALWLPAASWITRIIRFFGHAVSPTSSAVSFHQVNPDLLRRSQLAVFHGSPSFDNFVLPLFDYLRSLQPGHLSSLLAILWLSPSPGLLESLQNYLASNPLVLDRLESDLPPECVNVLEQPDGRSSEQLWATVADQVQYISRVVYRGTLQWDRPLASAPVVIPRAADLPLKVGLLGAARIRSGPPHLVEGTSLPPTANTWPEMPMGTGHVLCTEIAECVHADLAAAGDSQTRSDHRSMNQADWPTIRQAIRTGARTLDRLVLISLGDDDSQGLLRSLPAVLYAATPPAPVLAFRVAPSVEKRMKNAFLQTLRASEAIADRIASGVEPRHGKTWDDIARARQELQRLLASAIPIEYVRFLERQRPMEIIAFTDLPIEWLDIDNVPLGLLTKISRVRVESRYGDVPAVLGLVRSYNSLTDSDYQPAPEAFKVVCIAPHYDGGDQLEVNRIIEMTKIAVEQLIKKQVALKKDIQLEMVDGLVDRNQVTDRLSTRWDLIFYIGHARDGRLQLSAGPPFDISQIQHRAFEGSVAVLLGCTTEGVRDLAGSITNEMVALGARAVFSMPARVHSVVMQELVLNLTIYLIDQNMLFGDALQITRFSILFSYAFLHSVAIPTVAAGVKTDLFRAIADRKMVIASPADADYERFRNGWDRFYRYVVDFLEEPCCPIPAIDIVHRASAVALNVSFAGNLRDRLFIF